MFFWLTIFWIPRIDNVFLFDAILRIFYITLPFLYELEMWVDFKGGKALNAATTTIFVTLPTFFSCSSNTASFQGKTWIRDVNLTFKLHRLWREKVLNTYFTTSLFKLLCASLKSRKKLPYSRIVFFFSNNSSNY